MQKEQGRQKYDQNQEHNQNPTNYYYKQIMMLRYTIVPFIQRLSHHLQHSQGKQFVAYCSDPLVSGCVFLLLLLLLMMLFLLLLFCERFMTDPKV